MKGTYLLVIALDKDIKISVGKRGTIHFPKHTYVYVGSALNGLEQRTQRHLRQEKKRYWHIDYFLEHAKVIDVFYKESPSKIECIVAKILEKKLESIPGFGCSDCSCASHLFFGSTKDITSIINELHMKKANS